MSEDLDKSFINKLRDSVISLEFEANSGKNNMYTAKEKNCNEVIPRGGVILGENGKVGSRYYKYEDILNAIEEFSKELSEQTEAIENEEHEVTATKKSEVDVKAFVKTIKSALKVYVEKNEKISNQDARRISMDVFGDVSGKTKMTKGGMFAGKGGSELENGEYVSEEDIKLAINELIVDVPPKNKKPAKNDKNAPGDSKNTPQNEDKDLLEEYEEKKHIITENKGKSKNKWWKKVVVILATVAISLSVVNVAYAPGGDSSNVYVKEIEEVSMDRNIVLDVNSDYEDGIGAKFDVKYGLEYGADTREDLDVQLGGNKYVTVGDTCEIDGISINDIDTGDIVTSTYVGDESSEKKVDIHDFIEENAPETGGTYKVYVHIKQLEEGKDSTRLGWVKAGMARDTGIIEKSRNTKYVVVEEENGEIKNIEEVDNLPEGTGYLDIEKASDAIKDAAQDYLKNENSNDKNLNEEIDGMEER